MLEHLPVLAMAKYIWMNSFVSIKFVYWQIQETIGQKLRLCLIFEILIAVS